MSGIEYGANRVVGRSSPFKPTWGPPPGESSARAGWLAANLECDLLLAGQDATVRALMPGVEPRRMPGSRAGHLDPRHALLRLRERQLPPW